MDQVQQLRSHVLIFPFPAQGHVNSMLKLAELLCLAGINITFLVSCNVHNRLLRHTNVVSRFSKYPGFHLDHYPDAYDENKVHIAQEIMDLYTALQSVVKPFLKELLSKDRAHGTGNKPPFSCIITDGMLSLALDVAEEIGLPLICFRAISAGAFWTYFCIPQLVEAGELPFSGDDMNMPVENVEGMERFLRRCDLPSFFRVGDLTNPNFNLLLKETLQTPRAKGLILNTFEKLEGPILSHLQTYCPNLYSIGPLHAHLKIRLQLQEADSNNSNSNSLWEEDKSCINWLDNQPPKSVLYVSFGSITIVTREKLLELWHGIVNSGIRFLWAIRTDSVKVGSGDDVLATTKSKSTLEMELEEATKKRGCVVGWAPQEEVLAHPAIGGFLTHCGWNSTLESIAEGVPMICWPYFSDQQPNSRFVGEVWKLGLDMKDTCDRVIVEKMIRDLMVERKDDFLQRADQMAKLARKSIEEGGSSFCNLVRLIDDIVKG